MLARAETFNEAVASMGALPLVVATCILVHAAIANAYIQFRQSCFVQHTVRNEHHLHVRFIQELQLSDPQFSHKTKINLLCNFNNRVSTLICCARESFLPA